VLSFVQEKAEKVKEEGGGRRGGLAETDPWKERAAVATFLNSAVSLFEATHLLCDSRHSASIFPVDLPSSRDGEGEGEGGEGEGEVDLEGGAGGGLARSRSSHGREQEERERAHPAAVSRSCSLLSVTTEERHHLHLPEAGLSAALTSSRNHAARYACEPVGVGAGAGGAKKGRQGLCWERGLRILVVDDTLTNRKVTRKLLTSLGHHVTEAADGLEFLRVMAAAAAAAVLSQPLDRDRDRDASAFSRADLDRAAAAAARSSPSSSSSPTSPSRSEEGDHPCTSSFDVVLMDDHMPNLTGPDATYVVRKMGYRGLIFGVTGNTFDQERKRFLDHGADKVFAKPLDLELLRRAIKEA
jgi:CheY-like chemotaxis protein